MKKIIRFFRQYKQFGFVILTLILGAVLDITGYDTAAHWVLGVSAIANTLPLVWGMWQDFRSGSYGLDVLAITAIVTSVLLKEYWAGIVIVLMLTGGQALEDYAERRAKEELSDLLKQVPTKAHVMKGRKVIDVAVSQIYTSDKIVIKPGEVVPVDAVILDGTASFDEASLTGESLPTVKNAGQEILS